MTGNSMDLLQAHHIPAMTLEVANSFQPPAADLEELLNRPCKPISLLSANRSVNTGSGPTLL